MCLTNDGVVSSDPSYIIIAGNYVNIRNVIFIFVSIV